MRDAWLLLPWHARAREVRAGTVAVRRAGRDSPVEERA